MAKVKSKKRKGEHVIPCKVCETPMSVDIEAVKATCWKCCAKSLYGEQCLIPPKERYR
jgi:hypothetical protein